MQTPALLSVAPRSRGSTRCILPANGGLDCTVLGVPWNFWKTQKCWGLRREASTPVLIVLMSMVGQWPVCPRTGGLGT